MFLTICTLASLYFLDEVFLTNNLLCPSSIKALNALYATYPMPQLFASEKLNAAWEMKPKISLEFDKRIDFTSDGSHNSLILLTYSEGSALVFLAVFFLETCNNIME